MVQFISDAETRWTGMGWTRERYAATYARIVNRFDNIGSVHASGTFAFPSLRAQDTDSKAIWYRDRLRIIGWLK